MDRADRPVRRLVTLPWIAQKGDALTAAIAETGGIALAPLRLHDTADHAARQFLLGYAARRPARFAALLEDRLLALGGTVDGLLLTHDWPPPLRLLVQVARAHGLPSLVVTHEAFFAEPERYYVDPPTGADVPAADRVLVWGHWQQALFVERGFPADRIAVVGSPKLAALADFRPPVDRTTLRRRLGVADGQKLVTLIGQPFDNLANPGAAQRAYFATLETLASLATAEGWRLCYRPPPARLNDGIDALIRARWPVAPPFAIVDPDGEGGGDCQGDARDPAVHLWLSDLTVGYCSTMLLEASLLDRPALIANLGLPPTLIEKRLGLPVACNVAELASHARQLLAGPCSSAQTPAGAAWAAWAFSDGAFADSQAPLARVRAAIRQHAAAGVRLEGRTRRFGLPALADRLDPGFSLRTRFYRAKHTLRRRFHR